MTIITNAEHPFEKGKCPMCGADVVYTAFGNQHSKPWKCTGCGGYGREDKTGFGPLHIDLKTVQGTDVVLMEPEDYTGPIVQVDLCNEAPPAEPEYPRTALFQSDYSPDTTMRITMTEDGDVIFKIRGPGEMRIATSGGHFHGQQLAKFCEAAKAMLEVVQESNK